MTKRKTYKVIFNGLGIVFVIASSMTEAEKKFLESGYGGKDVEIKSISVQPETDEPLSAN